MKKILLPILFLGLLFTISFTAKADGTPPDRPRVPIGPSLPPPPPPAPIQ